MSTLQSPPGGIGSFFHRTDLPRSEEFDLHGLGHLTSTGRAAIEFALTNLMKEEGQKRVLVPSYYCWDVTRFLERRYEVKAVAFSPVSTEIPTEMVGRSDVLIIPSYFGAEPPPHHLDPGQVLLDVTHDPFASWIRDYPADWTVGSLRKTLPIPDGGSASTRREPATAMRSPWPQQSRGPASAVQRAMESKSRWIDQGAPKDKQHDVYSRLVSAEAELVSAPGSEMSDYSRWWLNSNDVYALRRRRLENLEYLRQSIDGLCATLPSTYGLPLVLPTVEQADAVHAGLVQRNIFPARLWLLPDAHSAYFGRLDRRILLIHTDFRYSRSNMDYVTHVLTDLLSG